MYYYFVHLRLTKLKIIIMLVVNLFFKVWSRMFICGLDYSLYFCPVLFNIHSFCSVNFCFYLTSFCYFNLVMFLKFPHDFLDISFFAIFSSFSCWLPKFVLNDFFFFNFPSNIFQWCHIFRLSMNPLICLFRTTTFIA